MMARKKKKLYFQVKLLQLISKEVWIMITTEYEHTLKKSEWIQFLAKLLQKQVRSADGEQFEMKLLNSGIRQRKKKKLY